ncbi:helix-turn-helix domain-containing protein [Paracoccus litorisediminis]|uniref:Helix-turn-helix domain-containing protein n=1 Tax=Paracoccus litorisediminis TaxID=2006130 RepID=A0A844HVA9_9RHOB|nr:helix-turn-helix domain-containing protein [Paracoccus litorisediminis]
MVTLDIHLLQSGEKQADFAQRVQVRQGTISKLCRRQMTPSLRLAQRIERATGGKVPVSVWVSSEAIVAERPDIPAPTIEHPHVPTS